MAFLVRTALRSMPRLAGRTPGLPAVRAFQQGPLAASLVRQPSLGLRGFSAVRYAETHEWFESEGEMGTLGISDFAQGALGEVVYCELPEVGAKLKAKQVICTLESVKAVGEVYAPVDCEIIEVNEKLGDEPALVNSSPQSDGWLVKVKFSGSTDSMMDQAAYTKHLESESHE
ncbi:unnamed protein product [Polarella glacialis]|uniref:Glycine cleavage system H protein n=1 Tax=Polarella glacialis TaxID=89957 RepID=A0A813LCF3_POLGL|nr:unnamed protein product [Polarella glacialis]CAE8584571.1 unnamed protein product [Polarella glacialis]CAE8724076.1 unnamed protein product [Polarella glacialis]